MAHLIQPLDVDGSLLCVAYHGNRATEIINTELVVIPTDLATITAPQGPWEMHLVGVASDFEVSFGTGCASTVEMQFSVSTSASTYYVSISVYVNGVADAGQVITESTGSIDPLTIDLTNYPCGNVISVYVNLLQDDDEDVLVTGSINSIA